jgi:exosortase
VLFTLFLVLSAFAFYHPLKYLFVWSFHDRLYSHIPLIPLLSGYFFYSKRKAIFSHVEYSLGPGVTLIGIGSILSVVGFTHALNLSQNDSLSLLTFSAVLVWAGAFVLFYGLQTSKKAIFPLLLLFLMTPVPTFLTDAIVGFLRISSVETVYGLLYLLDFPVLHEGYVLHFPKLSIRITEECSGFGSFMAVAITSIIAGHLFLRKKWTKLLLVVAVVPITVLKNALRIVAISLIAVYMGEEVFLSVFHKLVGFSVFAFLILFALIVLLRRLESRALQDGEKRNSHSVTD